jgi:AcrR family transcriptional regulator
MIGELLQPAAVRELEMLQGFVPLGWAPPNGERRVMARHMYARIVAVDLAVERGTKVTLREIAEIAGLSERTLHLQFGSKEALFAFPPPELATAIVRSCLPLDGQGSGEAALYELFRQLDKNAAGKRLLQGLARIHEHDRSLSRVDNHFAFTLREELTRIGAPTGWVRWAGYFTDGLIEALKYWATTPEQSITVAVPMLLGSEDPTGLDATLRDAIRRQ